MQNKSSGTLGTATVIPPSGPAPASPLATKPAVAPAILQVSEREDGKYLIAKKGDYVVINLSAKPSAGFSWQVTSATTAGVLVGSQFDPPEPLRPGGNVAVHFKFRIEGNGLIQLNYARPTDSETSRFVRWFTIDVAADF